MGSVHRTVGKVLGLVAIGAASFAAARALMPAASVIAADNSVYSVAEVIKLANEDDGKPRFIGNMNGIEFKSEVGAVDLGCVGEIVDATAEDVDTSPLNFIPSYLPKGASFVGQGASSCDGKLVSLGRLYSGPTFEVNVARFSGPSSSATAPVERIQETSVGHKRAVLISELPSPGMRRDSAQKAWKLVIQEPFGITEIRANGLTLGEIMNISKGLE